MKITKINGEEYSEDKVKKILQEKWEILRSGMLHSSAHPYEFSSTGDIATILFEKSDKEGAQIPLPLQTNSTLVGNFTTYGEPYRMGFIKRLFMGKPESIITENLEDFLRRLVGMNVTDLSLYQRHKLVRDSDFTIKDSVRVKLLDNEATYRPDEKTLRERLDAVKNSLVRFPERFLIDPKSDLKVESRVKGDSRVYKAGLGVRMYTGISSEPGLNDYFIQTIEARVRKEEGK